MSLMRTPRIKVPSSEGEAYYHLITRTVNGEHLFHATDKEMLRRMIWLVAEYCGIQLLTYAILVNHFHLVVRVPQSEPLSDAELVLRYERMHPPTTAWTVMRLVIVKRDLAENGERAARFRARQHAIMGDISPFMQLLKQRFATWFNRSHERFGTLWAERYTSVLVERGTALRRCTAYVDLNAVRSGLTTDPKDYRFCGYAEAVAGNPRAQAGILAAFGGANWQEYQGTYRRHLFIESGQARPKGAVLSEEFVKPVLEANGQLRPTELLRCRLRYLSESAALGSKAFVAEQLLRFRERTGRGRRMVPNPLPPEADWPDVTAFRRLSPSWGISPA